MAQSAAYADAAFLPEAQSEIWEIGYRWSYGDRARRWLSAASAGRLIGFRAPAGTIFIPPTAPVEAAGRELEEVDLGPGGTVGMLTIVAGGKGEMRSRLVGWIRLDGAPVFLCAEIELPEPWSFRLARRMTPGVLVRFVAPSAPVRDIADLRFRPIRDG